MKNGQRPVDSKASNSSKMTTNSTGSHGSDNMKKQQHGLNADQKAVRSIISGLRNKMKKFQKKHMGARARYDFRECAESLEKDVLEEWNMDSGGIQDHEEFLMITLQKPLDEDVLGSDLFVYLLSIAERGQDFDILIPEVKRKLSQCLETHARQSFKSLREESDGEVLMSAEDYEEHIKRYKADIEEKQASLEEMYKEYKALVEPFLEFVRRGEEHTDKMKKICTLSQELCHIVSLWNEEDQEYPNKLQEEMKKNNLQIWELESLIKEYQTKQSENKKEMASLKKQQMMSERTFMGYRKEKHSLMARQVELEERKAWLEEKMEKKREQRERLKEQNSNSGGRTPRDSFENNEMIGKLAVDIEKLESQRKITLRQLKRVEKDFKPINDKAYEYKVEMVTYRHDREAFQKENMRLADEIINVQERIRAVKSQNASLKKVREMRLSPEAYRKNLRQKQKLQTQQHNGSLTLAEACKYAAPSIGKDWKKVYLYLPFEPPRDSDRRQHDVAMLDKIAARNDVTLNEQALRSLEKWRAFHRRGHVTELIDTLRRVQKQNVASKIEHRFIGATAK